MSQSLIFRGVKTYVERGSSVDYYVYRGTAVVRYDKLCNAVTLRTGGWSSVTTKLRMNQASNENGWGWVVFQRDFKWYVRTPRCVIDFTAGMTINMNDWTVLR